MATIANAPVMFIEGAASTGFTDNQPPPPGSEEEKGLVDAREKRIGDLKKRRQNAGDEAKAKRRRKVTLLNMLGFSDQDDHLENEPESSTDEDELFGDGPQVGKSGKRAGVQYGRGRAVRGWTAGRKVRKTSRSPVRTRTSCSGMDRR